MAVRMEYKCGSKAERFLLSVCYMTVEGTGVKENRRKYGILRRLTEENEGTDTSNGRHEWAYWNPWRGRK